MSFRNLPSPSWHLVIITHWLAWAPFSGKIPRWLCPDIFLTLAQHLSLNAVISLCSLKCSFIVGFCPAPLPLPLAISISHHYFSSHVLSHGPIHPHSPLMLWKSMGKPRKKPSCDLPFEARPVCVWAVEVESCKADPTPHLVGHTPAGIPSPKRWPLSQDNCALYMVCHKCQTLGEKKN